jgi:hypothetical protein
LLPHTKCSSAVPVMFHNCYDSVTIVAGRLPARWEASGPNKRLLSRNIYSKQESWTTALSLTEKGQTAALQRKIPLVRKSYSL